MKALNIFFVVSISLLMFGNTQAHNHWEMMMPINTMGSEITLENSETIVDIAVGNEDFSTLVTAVVEAGLVDALSAEGPFTVFAPLNSAFAKLPDGTVEVLLMEENRELLQSVLTYHVLAWDVRASALQRWLQVETLQGAHVRFEMTGGKWYINGAEIIATDIIGSNGVIHVIDSVILPPASMEDMEIQKEMIEEMLTESEMRLVTNFDWALQNLLSWKSMNVQNILTNRVLSTIDIALNTMSLNESQIHMLEYIRLHITLK